MLKPGTYKLTKTIPNPETVDKRVTRDWRKMPELASGTVVIVEPLLEYPSVLTVYPFNNYSHYSVNHKHAWFKAIEDSNPEPYSDLDTIVAAGHTSALTILRMLVDDGVVTLEQIQEISRR